MVEIVRPQNTAAQASEASDSFRHAQTSSWVELACLMQHTVSGSYVAFEMCISPLPLPSRTFTTPLVKPGAVLKPGGCNTPLDGNRKEMGGGHFEISVFSYACSGAPVPVPPPPPPPPVPPPCKVFNEYGCAELYNPCLNASEPAYKYPFCDQTAAISDRVQDAIARMTLEEKIGMLDQVSPPIAALGVPAYNWWNEASTGVANEVNKRGSKTSTTKFAFPITTGMSFNRTLWSLTGRQIGREARAMMNVGTAYSTFWAPVINLAREVRCRVSLSL